MKIEPILGLLFSCLGTALISWLSTAIFGVSGEIKFTIIQQEGGHSMADVKAAAKAAGEGAIRETAAQATVEAQKAVKGSLDKVLSKIGGAAEKILDDLTNAKGVMDDSGFSIIKTAYYTVCGEKPYNGLLRLLGFLTEPERQDFGLACIGQVVLTASNAESKLSEKETTRGGSVVEKNLTFFFGINFTDNKVFGQLFSSLDLLVEEFLNMESSGQDNRENVVQLLKLHSFYGDSSMVKRLYGLAANVSDWKVTLGRWRRMSAGWAKEFLEELEDQLDEPLEKFDRSSRNALQAAKDRLQQSRNLR